MTKPRYWTKIARHPKGHVLYACFVNPLKPPWVKLKVMKPGPIKKRLGERARVWAAWNTVERRLNHCPDLEAMPEIYNWVQDTLEAAAEREMQATQDIEDHVNA